MERPADIAGLSVSIGFRNVPGAVVSGATGFNRRWAVLENVIDQVYGIGDIDRVVAIVVTDAERIGWWAVLENVIDQVNGVADVDVSLAAGVTAHIDDGSCNRELRSRGVSRGKFAIGGSVDAPVIGAVFKRLGKGGAVERNAGFPDDIGEIEIGCDLDCIADRAG